LLIAIIRRVYADGGRESQILWYGVVLPIIRRVHYIFLSRNLRSSDDNPSEKLKL